MPPTADDRSNTMVRDLFQKLDRMDADGFAEFLTEDARFRFGNADVVTGRGAIRDAVTGFFGSIASLRHDIDRVWITPEAIACDGSVTYGRHDGKKITLPFADVFAMRGDRIAEYLIYIDIAPLYA